MVAQTSDTTEVPTLFMHTRRPAWGLAIVARRRKTKRTYQFQDGRLRTIKQGWYELLEPVDRPLDETMDIVADLEAKLDIGLARREVRAAAKKSGRYLPTFEDQLKVLAQLYPGGFQDPAYTSGVRGVDASRARRGHRDPAIALATDTLGRERLDELIAGRQWDGVHEAATKLAAASDLFGTTRDRRALVELPEDKRPGFAKALREHLHGDGDFVRRMTDLTVSLTWDGKPSWPLVTGFGALVHPEEQVAIKPSAIRAQARWMAPRLEIKTTPTTSTYLRCRAMARSVRDKLLEHGLEPRDLIDVYEFMWQTLRPKSLALLEELRA